MRLSPTPLFLLAAASALTPGVAAHAAPVAMNAVAAAETGARTRVNINPVWRFQLGDPAGASAAAFDDKSWQVVSLPHTHEVFPADLSGFPEHGRRVGWYRRTLDIPADWSGKRVNLEFQGAMQTTKLWVNGVFVGEYAVSGYDTFHFDITPHLKPGANTLAIRVDNTMNADIPPDGQKMDFMPFGGLYRDLHVVVTDPLHITFPWEDAKAGIRLTLPEVSKQAATVLAETTVRNDGDKPREVTLVTEVRDRDGKVVAVGETRQSVAPGASQTVEQKLPAIANPVLWSPANPYLYKVHTRVMEGGREVDRVVTRLGVRWVTWDKKEGFFLNGEHLKLVGANRHQTWPFIGNALPDGLHRRDAEQLKEMGCNWVRCSHYPHDPDFLDALDELGIMALEEGPTWMKRGGDKWMNNLELSFRRMIRRDRNHPALIIWNACVNHSGGEKRLITAATEEDPTRARGQDTVRCPMDFSHKRISGGGALCIEHTGHTFDTERGEIGKAGKGKFNWVAGQDTDNREYELMLKHWEHTDAAYKKKDNSGLAVWAMYDYNTFHNATDGIARHGVLDLFRLPKHTWWWHKAELTAAPTVYTVRVNATKACVVANADEVRLTQLAGAKTLGTETRKPDAGFVLKAPPFHFAVNPEATELKAEALRDGRVVATHSWKKAGEAAAITLETDRAAITADGADISRIIATVVDAAGTPLPQGKQEVTFALEGAGRLIGENPVKLRAGKMIILAQSTLTPGDIRITAKSGSLTAGSVSLKTTPVAAGVDMPAVRPELTNTGLIVKGGATTLQSVDELSLDAKKDVAPGVWVESDPIMLGSNAKLTISGGEYKIYTAEWTDKPGKIKGGDAVFFRVKSSTQPGGKAKADITVNDKKIAFEVITRK